jgi:CelD/BcsL family acetyltransferase involved in cellulose biosynthesis
LGVNIYTIQPRELDATLRDAWHAIRRGQPALASPYFCPEYVEIAARVRGGVEIAILEDGGDVAGFLPFERTIWNTARPVGGKLSDFQAAIALPDSAWKMDDMLSACRLRQWEFDHVLAEQPQWAPFHTRVRPSPYIDLSRGAEHYFAERKSAGVRSISQAWRKLKKLEREVGPLRFEWNEPTAAVLKQLRAWKSQQYIATGQNDLFASRRQTQFLQQIATATGERFAGVTCTLYAGEQLAAVHLGMRSDNVLHYWFPAYEPQLSKYSPGLGLILLLAEQAAERGMTKLDLGKGDEEYKQSFASASTPVAEGIVAAGSFSRALRSSWQATREWVKASPLREPAKVPVRWMRRMRDWIGAP